MGRAFHEKVFGCRRHRIVEMKMIGFFHEVDADKCGGKGKSLIALQDAGFTVPPGFILTYDAYSLYKETGHMPAAVKEQVISCYRKLKHDTGSHLVSVRSSASAEDLPNASFAGLYETYLYVESENDLSERIIACWQSLFNERAAAYRAQRHIPETGLKMAVIIQTMIDPKCAGILFTTYPYPGKPRQNVMIVESNWGCAETVVSGKATPDHFVIAKDGHYTLLEKSPGEKEVVLQGGRLESRDPADPGSPTGEFSLTGDELKRLCQLGDQIEAHFKHPQDIEWALDPQDKLFILQSRPVTAGLL